MEPDLENEEEGEDEEEGEVEVEEPMVQCEEAE